MMAAFFLIQLIKGVPLYDLYVPPKMEMYMEQVQKLIDFESLSPDGLVQVVYPNETLSGLITGNSNKTEEGAATSNV